MPKSTKKQKDKAADFSKAKLKLGKGNQPASNVVDTSFRSRAIALPEQSIGRQRSADTPLTKRKLTFDDVLIHLKHYNAATRRDAIGGLREIIEDHIFVAHTQLSLILSRCARMMGDEDASVRKALVSFFSWFIPLVSRHDFKPHCPMLLLFATSALTHIYPEIRVDAIKFLDIFLEHFPDLVVDGWADNPSSHGRRVLEGYLGLLNAGTVIGSDGGPNQATSTASVILSPKSKLTVLASLSTFLCQAVGDRSSNTFTWFMAPFCMSQSGHNVFVSLISPHAYGPPLRHFRWDTGPHLEERPSGLFCDALHQIRGDWSLHDLSNSINPSSKPDWDATCLGCDAECPFLTHLARALQPTLLSTYLDCGPVAFPPAADPPETELRMVLAVAEILRSVYGQLLRDSKKFDLGQALEDLYAILEHMSPYFPAPVSMAGDMKVKKTYETLNLVFCELASLPLLAPTTSRRGHRDNHLRHTSATAPTPAGISSPQIDRVKRYTLHLLRGDLLVDGKAQTGLPRAISQSSYTALLPTIWTLINSPSHDWTPSELLVSVIDHALQISSNSAVKEQTVNFLGLLLLLETESHYFGTVRVGQHPEVDSKFREWVLCLPKVLWELGSSNLATTEIILRLLLRLTQRRSSILDASASAGLCIRLAPYFTMTHATRGRLPGPFTRLPASSCARKLALDVAATLSQMNQIQAHDLIEAVSEALCESSEEDWRSMMGCQNTTSVFQ